jgi:hypothetical protein
MPANQDSQQEESTKDQPAVPDLEITTEELELEDSENVSGGHIANPYMSG